MGGFAARRTEVRTFRWTGLRIGVGASPLLASEPVTEPFINCEEQPDRTVGRRQLPADCFETGMRLQEAMGEYLQAFGHLPLPRGVFRFQTHEEADEWMLKMLARHRKS